jgi:SAM-dependent methyltransferase
MRPRDQESDESPAFDRDKVEAFLRATTGRPLQPWSERAIGIALDRRRLRSGGRSERPRACDLGCGAGNEVLALLDRGFDVDAFDAAPDAIAVARSRAASHPRSASAAIDRTRLEALELPEARYDLVHARFALPFVAEAAFPRVWRTIAAALVDGGVFAGQLFGPSDEDLGNARSGTMNAHDAAAVRRLIASSGYAVVEHEEVERDGVTATGRSKHWHVHHLILVRGDGSTESPRP